MVNINILKIIEDTATTLTGELDSETAFKLCLKTAESRIAYCQGLTENLVAAGFGNSERPSVPAETFPKSSTILFHARTYRSAPRQVMFKLVDQLRSMMHHRASGNVRIVPEDCPSIRGFGFTVSIDVWRPLEASAFQALPESPRSVTPV